ncbi:MAG: alcohol dehydrogenase catalytic domain-containing protein [Acidimicrobiia bacterium]|nr:alcohol dehydrogenase catalytic domain-containing protein [Acidimicrobiia bacterium]
MKAVVTTGPGVLEAVDVPCRSEEGTVSVRLERAGICGTDLNILDGAMPIRYPLTLGHEMVGTVTRTPPGAQISPGARVLVNPSINCDACYLCESDRAHLCSRGGLLGRDADGVFAETIGVPERFLHPVPEGIGLAEAGLLQVLGTVVHSQQNVPVSSETLAVVIGLGVSGLLHLQLLNERGAGRVIGITRSRRKLDLARNLGAHAVATPDEAMAVVTEISEGRGADLVVEAVGTEATVLQAIELCGYSGCVVIYGTVTGGMGKLPFYRLYLKELTLRFPRAARAADYDTAIGLATQGRMELAPLITAHFPLGQAAAAFAAARSGDHLKVLLTR